MKENSIKNERSSIEEDMKILEEFKTHGYAMLLIKYEDRREFQNYLSYLESRNNLYFKDDTSKANAMWLASPSSIDTNNVILVNFDGGVRNCNYGGGYGLRPLACLKSDIRFEETEAGFRII